MEKVKVKEVWAKDGKSLEPIKIQFEHSEVLGEDVIGTRDLSGIFTSHLYSGHAFNRRKAVSLSNPDEPSTSKKIAKVVALENDSMLYVGSTESDFNQGSVLKSTSSSSLSSSGSGMKTFIVVRRKNKNRAKLYEATPITVSPYVQGRTYIDEKEKETKRTLKEKRLANAELVKDFGSKKKRLYLERLEKNRVTDMNDSILSAAADARVEEELPDAQINNDSILALVPPCDRNAGLPSEVYKVSDILSEEELQELEELAYKCLTCSAEDIKYFKKNKIFSDLFYKNWEWLHVRPNDEKNLLSMKLILYAEILIRLFRMKHPDFRKKAIPFPQEFPVSLVTKALDMFTTVNALNQRNRSEELRNKTCCYIMVLVLLACDLTFDMQLMAPIFQIHIKKLLTLTKVVGMTVNNNPKTKEYSARLKLPLPKQIENRGAKRTTRR